MRDLQLELDNPIAVFDSETRNDSQVVLTRLIDRQNNERAVVAIRMDMPASGRLRINVITSAASITTTLPSCLVCHAPPSKLKTFSDKSTDWTNGGHSPNSVNPVNMVLLLT